MAKHRQLPAEMLQSVDETNSNWLVEVFGKWIDQHLVTQAEFVVHLGQIMLLAARHASTVFVGRGVQFILPREQGLAVRLIAPWPRRVARVMEVRGLGKEEAERYIVRCDEGRRNFVKRYFRQDLDNPRLYDLVINVERLTIACVVDLIVNQLQQCFNLPKG